MREGSLEPPVRHPIAWEDPDYYDAEKIEAELRRSSTSAMAVGAASTCATVSRACFDLIEQLGIGELDSVESSDFGPVVDAAHCAICAS